MKTILVFCSILLGFTSLSAQNNNFETEKKYYPDTAYRPEDSNKIWAYSKVMPKFQGNLMKYLSDSIQYPDSAKDIDIVGTLYMSFVVEKDGSITNIKVLRGIPGGNILDRVAVRIIKEMPKWTPGKQDGHPVRIQYTIPIHFKRE
jgi:protein TonB